VLSTFIEKHLFASVCVFIDRNESGYLSELFTSSYTIEAKVDIIRKFLQSKILNLVLKIQVE